VYFKEQVAFKPHVSFGFINRRKSGIQLALDQSKLSRRMGVGKSGNVSGVGHVV